MAEAQHIRPFWMTKLTNRAGFQHRNTVIGQDALINFVSNQLNPYYMSVLNRHVNETIPELMDQKLEPVSCPRIVHHQSSNFFPTHDSHNLQQPRA
jgi:hypothetical protein